MSLAEGMLAAADLIDKLNDYMNYGDRVPWSAKELRREAPHVEAEEREETEREAMIEDLAASMFEAENGVTWETAHPEAVEACRRVAYALIECGWRKEEPA